MKRLALLLVMLATLALNGQAATKAGYLQIGKTSYDFGTFNKNTVRSCVFVFTNTGKAPVVIEQATVTCNCTSTKFTTQPIMPGQKGYVTVYYNGKNYGKGYFRKNIDVRSNAENGIVRLFISGKTE